jgi:cytoskeletal protein RodZ
MTADLTAPTRAEQFGETVRRLRENAGVSLDTICAETKISRRILEALEAGHFQFLPERVFSRNFVRQYAHFVAADENQLLDWFDAAWERFLVTSGSHPSLTVDEGPPSRPIRWGFWLPIAIGLVLALAATAIILGRSREAAQTAPDQRRTMAGLPTPATNPTDVPPTATALEQAQPTPDEARAGGQGKLDLGLRVTTGKECWIRYRDREGRTEQRLLKAGEDLGLELEAPVLLTLGNAASVTLRVGATEYRDLGRPGEVLHVEVTRAGVTPLRSVSGDE